MNEELGHYLGREAIKAIIPHREPFLLIDYARGVVWGERAEGVVYDVSRFLFLSGHFPSYPVMPGAIVVQASLEVGEIAILGMPENKGKIAMLAGLDKWKFKKPALPGHIILLAGLVTELTSDSSRIHSKATSAGILLAEGDLLLAIVDHPTEFDLLEQK